MDREAFVVRYGALYEDSPWVAERAYDGGAAEGGDLGAVLRRVVERAGRDAQLALLRAHPDLGARLGSLSEASAGEQSSAGLDRCSAAELEELATLNARYVERFGFPFIIAVTGLDRGAILDGFRRRADGAPDEEFATALEEVHRIAALRLAALDAEPDVARTPVAYDEVVRLAHAALVRHGADDAHAAAIARNVAAAERDGSESHGLFRVAGYARALTSGVIDGRAVPRITAGDGAVLRMDGQRCAAPLAYETALPELARRAHDKGIAALSLTNVAHFAALWPEVEWLAGEGLVAAACTANFAYMAPFGGSRPMLGTNPFAFAVPGDPPLVVDMATSAMARGDVMIAARRGRSVDAGVGLTRDGTPTTDATAILKGAQLPFGGAKGSAVALVVECLAGLCGGPFSDEATDASGSGVPVGSVFVAALAPEALGGPDALRKAQAFLERLTRERGVRLPGARRHARRAHQGDLHVDEATLAAVRRLADP